MKFMMMEMKLERKKNLVGAKLTEGVEIEERKVLEEELKKKGNHVNINEEAKYLLFI